MNESIELLKVGFGPDWFLFPGVPLLLIAGFLFCLAADLVAWLKRKGF